VADLLHECLADFRRKANITTAIPTQDFKESFCAWCKNPECVNSFGDDLFTHRVRTQFNRLCRPDQGDPKLPKYAQIVETVWQDMTQKALQLEISARRGDWEVPVVDGSPEAASPADTAVVDEAVRQLARSRGQDEPDLPQPAEDDFAQAAEEILEGLPEPEPETPTEPKPQAPQHPKKDPQFKPPNRGNTEVPVGGIMIGGEAPPTPEQEVDSWAPPAETGTVVKAGAVIRLGVGGEITDD